MTRLALLLLEDQRRVHAAVYQTRARGDSRTAIPENEGNALYESEGNSLTCFQ